MMFVINFIKENYRLIIEIVVLIGSLVFFLVKKKPLKLVDGAVEWLLKMIPVVINSAEETDLKGTNKLFYVIQTLKDIAAKTGVISADYFDYYISFIKDYVEIILSTPQKKGCDTDGKK